MLERETGWRESFLTACCLNLSKSLIDVRMDKERQLHICVGLVGWVVVRSLIMLLANQQQSVNIVKAPSLIPTANTQMSTNLLLF